MALKTINDLTALTSPAAADFLGVWNVSGGVMRKSTLAQVVTNAGVAAIKTAANTFTAAQVISPATAVVPLTLTPVASVGDKHTLILDASDNGASTGSRLVIRHNNNGSTPAAGSFILNNRAGTARVLWQDASNLIRIHTAAPTNATDTAGSVLGDQTSNAAFKDIAGAPVNDDVALANVVAAADDVQRFTYKSGAYNGQEFSGIVLDGETLHRYGKDADAEYPAGKALNDVTLLGDLVLALREIDRRLTTLEA